MIYPEYIYPELEIVEKEIAGQKHYGLIRTRRLFGIIPIKQHVKMTIIDRRTAYECSELGLRWLEYRGAVVCVVEKLRQESEWYYERWARA